MAAPAVAPFFLLPYPIHSSRALPYVIGQCFLDHARGHFAGEDPLLEEAERLVRRYGAAIDALADVRPPLSRWTSIHMLVCRVSLLRERRENSRRWPSFSSSRSLRRARGVSSRPFFVGGPGARPSTRRRSRASSRRPQHRSSSLAACKDAARR